jgi:hypothetical protein
MLDFYTPERTQVSTHLPLSFKHFFIICHANMMLKNHPIRVLFQEGRRQLSAAVNK